VTLLQAAISSVLTYGEMQRRYQAEGDEGLVH